MYVDTAKSHQRGKTYTRALIRVSYRENGKIQHRTIANISKCSSEEINAIRLALKHKDNISEMIVDPTTIHSNQGLSVGAVLVLNQVCHELGITSALGNSERAKLALWMVQSRLIEPGSRLANVRLAQRHAAIDVLSMEDFNEDDLYSALAWLAKKQPLIERRLFENRYSEKKPVLFLYDVSSSYLEGTENELADWGYNRDKKKGKKIIIFGLLTDEDGWPISIEVFSGNTQDPKTVLNQIRKLANRFGCEHITFVGDRGMIKSCQIDNLNEHEFFYITAITKPQIGTLIDQKAIQMELFTEKICEIEWNDLRYILRRNPVRAKEIENTRNSKIQKVQRVTQDKNQYLNGHKKAVVAVAVANVEECIKKLEMSDIIKIEASGRVLSMRLDDIALQNAVRLDGCYVIKSNVPKDLANAETIHGRYKDLAHVEEAFRSMKQELLEIRPVFLRKEQHTRGYAFVVMLSYLVGKYLREKWIGLDTTVKEGMNELSTICAIEIEIGTVKINQIPEPRELGGKLVGALGITLPEAIPCRGIKVATRKKLTERRKRRK